MAHCLECTHTVTACVCVYLCARVWMGGYAHWKMTAIEEPALATGLARPPKTMETISAVMATAIEKTTAKCSKSCGHAGKHTHKLHQ